VPLNTKQLTKVGKLSIQLTVLCEICCSASKVLVDQGDYQLNVSADGNCSFTISNSPINSNWCMLCSLLISMPFLGPLQLNMC